MKELKEYKLQILGQPQSRPVDLISYNRIWRIGFSEARVSMCFRWDPFRARAVDLKRSSKGDLRQRDLSLDFATMWRFMVGTVPRPTLHCKLARFCLSRLNAFSKPIFCH
jgi:hypothetical protein